MAYGQHSNKLFAVRVLRNENDSAWAIFHAFQASGAPFSLPQVGISNHKARTRARKRHPLFDFVIELGRLRRRFRTLDGRNVFFGEVREA